MDQYPVVRLIVKHGTRVAAAIGVLPFLAALCYVFVCGGHAILLAVGAGVSALLFFLMKSYVELVQIMADMLMPKE